MSKKENLEKKEAMREINDSEVENVSGGVRKIGNKWVTTGIKGRLGKKHTQLDIMENAYDHKKDAIAAEKRLKDSGYRMTF